MITCSVENLGSCHSGIQNVHFSEQLTRAVLTIYPWHTSFPKVEGEKEMAVILYKLSLKCCFYSPICPWEKWYLPELTYIRDASGFKVIIPLLFCIMDRDCQRATSCSCAHIQLFKSKGFHIKKSAFSDVPLSTEPYWDHSSLQIQWVTRMKMSTLLDTGWAPTFQGLVILIAPRSRPLPSLCILGLCKAFRSLWPWLRIQFYKYLLGIKTFCFLPGQHFQLLHVLSSFPDAQLAQVCLVTHFLECTGLLFSSISGWSSVRCSTTNVPSAFPQS